MNEAERFEAAFSELQSVLAELRALPARHEAAHREALTRGAAALETVAASHRATVERLQSAADTQVAALTQTSHAVEARLKTVQGLELALSARIQELASLRADIDAGRQSDQRRGEHLQSLEQTLDAERTRELERTQSLSSQATSTRTIAVVAGVLALVACVLALVV